MSTRNKNAGSSESQRKVIGRPFEPGKSGNPDGLPAAVREIRMAVREALDKAFTGPGGSDELVTALVRGVSVGDGVCIKLACEYRWGKPVQQLEVSGNLATVTLTQLLDQLPEALAVLKGQGR